MLPDRESRLSGSVSEMLTPVAEITGNYEESLRLVEIWSKNFAILFKHDLAIMADDDGNNFG
jgi:hypothetical protein